MKIKPAFKIQGCKYPIVNWVLDHFPNNYESFDYIEPFAGAASVLLNKSPSISPKIEVLNDIDPGIVFILRYLRANSKSFIDKLERLRYSQATFDDAINKTTFRDEFEHAVNEFTLRGMSHGGNRKTYVYKPAMWKAAVKNLPCISERLQNVHIFNKPATQVIGAFDASENTVMYCDPPEEMTYEEHIQLFDSLAKVKGKVLVSGHSTDKHAKLYKEWNCQRKGTKTKGGKTPLLWKNF